MVTQRNLLKAHRMHVFSQQIVGCDNVIGSNATDDICGVCKGDGTSCTVKTIFKQFDKIPDENGGKFADN